jgi:hypothetical protein
MSGSSINDSKTRPSISTFVSRSRSIESSRLAGIVNLAKIIVASRSTPIFVASNPNRLSREYLLRSKNSGNNNDIVGRITTRDTALSDRPSSARVVNAYSDPSYLSTSDLFRIALRRLESDLNATRTAALFREGNAGNPYARSKAIQMHTADTDGGRRSIYQRLAALRISPSNEGPSVARDVSPNARQQLVWTRRALPIEAPGSGERANRISQLSAHNEITRILTSLRVGANRLIEAIRPSLDVRAMFSQSRSAKAATAFESFPLEGALAAGRGNRHPGLPIPNRPSQGISIEGRDTAKRLTLPRLAFTDTSPLFATTLLKRWLAAGPGAQMRKGWSASSQANVFEPAHTLSRATRSSSNFGELRNPVTINFSPTVVVSNSGEHGSIEDKVLETIRQHSYEVVRLVGREVHAQRRAAF